MTPAELRPFERIGNGQAAFEGGAEPSRSTFAVVASMRDRLSIAGDAESLGALLAAQSPTAILPGDWPEASFWFVAGRFERLDTIRRATPSTFGD